MITTVKIEENIVHLGKDMMKRTDMCYLLYVNMTHKFNISHCVI